jgi:hypothetical protein
MSFDVKVCYNKLKGRLRETCLEDFMAKQRTVRFDENLDNMVDQFTEKNGLKFNQLIALAVERFITEKNVIELEPVTLNATDSEWKKGMKESYSKHKKTMDELA